MNYNNNPPLKLDIPTSPNNSNIKFWRFTEKYIEIPFTDDQIIYHLSEPEERYDFQDLFFNKTIFVEGYSPSSIFGDTEIEIEYSDETGFVSESVIDYVLFTIFGTDLVTYKRDNTELLMTDEKHPGNYIVYNLFVESSTAYLSSIGLQMNLCLKTCVI